jgi:hypothetical protein
VRWTERALASRGVVGSVAWSFVSDLASKMSTLIVNLAAIALLTPDQFRRQGSSALQCGTLAFRPC